VPLCQRLLHQVRPASAVANMRKHIQGSFLTQHPASHAEFGDVWE
jgi:hypothetical protein